MSIDLVCYSSLPPDEVKGVIDSMTSENQGIFAEKFLISSVKDLRETDDYYDSVALEIALEYGMNATCSFSVGLNQKIAAGLLPTVESIIKSELGDGNVLILFNNEEPR